MLFTSPRDELSCQKLISPPDSNQFTGLCKIQSSGWHIKHQAWGKKNNKKNRRAGEESIAGFSFFFFLVFFFFLCGCFSLSQVLITAGVLRNINTRLFQGQKIKWLISVLTVRYPHTHTHTDAGMHAGQLRHVCSCSLIAPCQVREIWERRSHQSGPDLSNETFLLQRSVTDMNDE